MFFSISFDKCLSIYLVTQSVWCGLSGQPCYWFGETSTYNAFDLTDEIFENLNSISNIFQEPHDFLIFTDLVSFFLQEVASLSFPVESQPKFPRRKQWRMFSWSVERPSSKLLKWDLVYLLNTLGNPSLRIFAAGKASLIWNCRKRKTNTQLTDDVTTT